MTGTCAMPKCPNPRLNPHEFSLCAECHPTADPDAEPDNQQSLGEWS